MKVLAPGGRVGVAAAALFFAVISGRGGPRAGVCHGNFGLDGPGLALDGKPSDILLEDMNGDAADDMVVVVRDGTTTVLTVFFAQRDRTFAAPVTVPAGAQLSNVTSADFDLDGDSDLVGAGGDVLLLFRNKGNGDLEEPFSIPVRSGTSYVAAGDLLGDGAPDLAVVHQFDAKVAVLENRGGGDFDVAVTVDVGAQPTSVALGDQDADGDLDLAVSSRATDGLSLVRNLGGGSFAEAMSIESVGRRPTLVRAGDLHGDGAVELFVVAFGRVYLLNNDGTGRFGAPTEVHGTARDCQIADVDSDGDLDLAILSTSNRVYPRLNDGAGHLAEAPSLSTETAGQMLRLGDLDGDGDIDLALADTSGRVALLWNGAGRNVSLERLDVTGDMRLPHSIAIGDFDDDGFPDIVTGNGGGATISFLRSLGDGTLAPPVNFPVGGRLLSLASGDFNADGVPDVVSGDNGAREVRVMISRGDGTFADPVTHTSGPSPIKVIAADMTGDGFDEILTSDEGGTGSVSILVNERDGTFRLLTIAVGPGVQSSAAGDFDRDGDMDLAVVRGTDLLVYLSEGELSFGEPDIYADPSTPGDVVTADVDLDGDLDLVSGSAAYLGRGDGTFSGALPFGVGSIAFSMYPADIDRDGYPDLATVNRTERGLSVLLGGGDGSFRHRFSFNTASGPTRQIVAGDLDLDGDIEVISANRNSGSVTVLRNTMRPAFQGDFLGTLCTAQDFHALSVPARPGGLANRSLKYIARARDDDSLLPTAFQNTRRYDLHESFLEAVFRDRFPGGFGPGEYNRLTGLRETRQYYAGVLSRVRVESGVAYGFSVLVDSSSSPERLSLEEVRGVYGTLRSAIQLEPLGYFPARIEEQEDAAGWRQPGFPIYLAASHAVPSYVPYTRAVGYGRVRLLEEDAFEKANETGEISFQSVLVLERAPRDIEGVFAAVLTGEQQAELSHLSIRTARRGTPNAYLKDATLELASWEGRLVRLEVRENGYDIHPATLEEAETFWAGSRPELSQLPSLDADWSELSRLSDIATLDLDSRQESRFGGKATNLARLGRVLGGSPYERYRESGFAIPVVYFRDFLRTNEMPSALDPDRLVSYEEHLRELFGSDAFRTDSKARFRSLQSFRDYARKNGVVDPALLERLLERIAEVFGSTGARVRFRSSSNVEDILEFNGAGLYESTGVCADDDLDLDDAGPSLCDPSKSGERTLERALKKVWTSLYTFRAYEERAFFGVPEELTAMGILVSRTFPEELANGVAFTGSISDPNDKRYVVTVQVGEESVVHPDPGVLPEKDVLELTDGRVVRIIRPPRGSTLLPDGQWILSDAHLEELGRLMGFIDQNFPVELGGISRDQVVLDLEIKLEPDQSLAVKQVRPFLLTAPAIARPTFELEVPPDTVACGVFAESGVGRGLRDEYELKSQVRFVTGFHSLPTTSDSFSGDLVEGLRFGPEREVATPSAPGIFRWTNVRNGALTTYRLTWTQDFLLSGDRTLELRLVAPLEFEADGADPVTPRLVLDDTLLDREPGQELLVGLAEGLPPVRYGPCGAEHLPRRDFIRTELEDGTRIELEFRWRPSAGRIDTGAASLVRATVTAEESTSVVTDYWQLVYSAQRHNEEARYWVVLDAPLELAGLEAPVHVVELHQAEPHRRVSPQAFYLDEEFRVLARLATRTYGEETPGETPFRRGDVNADGRVDLHDALEIALHLFRGAPPPPCQKSANTDDNELLEFADVIYLLDHLFAGGPPPVAPYGFCGVDRSPDELSCVSYPACP